MIQRDKLGALSKIGQGGQGVVYRAPNVKTKFAASMVYKEYKPQARTDIDFTALAAMPALVEESLTYSPGRTTDLDCRLAVCHHRRRGHTQRDS